MKRLREEEKVRLNELADVLIHRGMGLEWPSLTM